ncbi:MAG: DUF3800 domain-containing protein [Thermovirgaceae bacterium]|nr:DUF3800 domain-containing protein [Thermovirgaceae bacterium]
MKFCYFDESGMGDEPVLVVAGIDVDAGRMRTTRKDWADFLESLSLRIGRPVDEFHTRNFYRGNRLSRTIDGNERAEVISAILDWLAARRHRITFSAILKSRFESLRSAPYLKDLGTPWSAAAFHCVLTLQRAHQGLKGSRRQTVLIFDREVAEEDRFSELIKYPPGWSREYYDPPGDATPLDTLLEAPLFADSRLVLLIQVADMVAYLLRFYAELQEGLSQESYPGERKQIEEWAVRIFGMSLPGSLRYPERCPEGACGIFWDLAPETLRR